MTVTAATKLVLSHPADLSDWGRQCLDRSSVRKYLTRVHDTATVGEVWDEFLGVGCCGDSLDVPLRVERVDGGRALTAGTEITFVERDDCSNAGGWRVQSEAGPSE